MKRLILSTLVLCLVAGTASAAQFGVRAGLSLKPDQFHLGGHVDPGPVMAPLRLVPNIEIGLGNGATLVALNGDLLYDFGDTPWSVGGELGVNIVNSNTDLGLSVLGNYRLGLNSGKTLLLEAKLGLSNSPDFKFTLGWNF